MPPFVEPKLPLHHHVLDPCLVRTHNKQKQHEFNRTWDIDIPRRTPPKHRISTNLSNNICQQLNQYLRRVVFLYFVSWKVFSSLSAWKTQRFLVARSGNMIRQNQFDVINTAFLSAKRARQVPSGSIRQPGHFRNWHFPQAKPNPLEETWLVHTSCSQPSTDRNMKIVLQINCARRLTFLHYERHNW